MSMSKVVVAAALVATLQFMIVAGKDYTVGQPAGLWGLNTNYTEWVSTITFNPGDNLLFNYTSGHDVWEVNKSDYDTCTVGTPLSKHTSGNDVIALTETGTRYFYCSVTGHCGRGMKVAVTVVDSNSPSSPPSPPNSPPSPDTVVTPPAPKGNAAAVTAVGSHFAVALVLGALLITFV